MLMISCSWPTMQKTCSGCWTCVGRRREPSAYSSALLSQHAWWWTKRGPHNAQKWSLCSRATLLNVWPPTSVWEWHCLQQRTTLNTMKLTWHKKLSKNMRYWAPGPLWPYNKFEVTRELWKAVATPALMLANSVMCLSSVTSQCLETREKWVGRMALEVYGGVLKEAMQRRHGIVLFWGTRYSRKTHVQKKAKPDTGQVLSA